MTDIESSMINELTLEGSLQELFLEVFVPAEVFPQPDASGHISKEGISRFAHALLQKACSDLVHLQKHVGRIPSGLPQNVAAALANLLDEAADIGQSQDQELSRFAEKLSQEAVVAADSLAKKLRVAWSSEATDGVSNNLNEEAIELLRLLWEAVGGLGILKKHRRPAAIKPGLPGPTIAPASGRFSTHRLSDSDFDTLRRRLHASIESWLPDHERTSNGSYLILSPFRDDKTKGSFVIFPSGKAHDFATGENFDVIDIWAAVNNMPKGMALKALSERYGLAPSRRNAEPSPAQSSQNIPPNGFPPPAKEFFVHSNFGSPGKVYKYFDCHGNAVGFVARYETPQLGRTKQFCPISFCTDSKGRPFWTRSAKGWNGLAPIYGLEYLQSRPDAPLIIVEGEKTVDAAVSLFPDHVVLTWQGGSGNAARANWKLLEGRNVEFIWPDADQKRDKTGGLLSPHLQPGMKAALAVFKALSSMGIKPRIVVPAAGLSDGWDLADAAEEGWTHEKALEYARVNSRDAADILRESEGLPKSEAGTPKEQRSWKPNDIVADIRRKFDLDAEEGTLEATFPFTLGYRNYAPSSGGSTREYSPILVSVSGMGRVSIVPVEKFIDEFVRWYDSSGCLNYGEVNLSDDQMRSLGLRLSLRMPPLDGEPLIFKRTGDEGHAWHILDIDSDRWNDLASETPESIPEAEKAILLKLSEICPSWHEQLTRMTNRMAFLCYLGSTLDLSAKPQQYLWLFGEGQDGKSSILKVLKKIFGPAAIATDWPENPNNFFTSRFEGRRLLLVDEEPEGACVRTDLWKRLTGADTITIEPKGKQAYEIRNNLLIVVGSNYRPSIKARKADLRRLIICELQMYDGVPDARFDERLASEFDDFISICHMLWHKFKGRSELAPVDEAMTRKNLEEISADLSEFLSENFEIHDQERIKIALQDENISRKMIPHVAVSEIIKVCKGEQVSYTLFKDYLTGLLGLPSQVIAYSKFDKKKVIFGVVPKLNTRRKFNLSDATFRHLQPVKEAN